ncbi:hypothetical protein HLK59_38020 [Streptomyces sp. S3(2020)]|uniref:hypothetical protein n=1 Tax=Streptomyces sp. S3(2020) TaxID=2732044 RepID=UPI001488E314|nr:hypothetical protein [Streptomyces sp. S3(2020)]NNN36062.1 hypothetical protein [Streptomyces sp. S3(2020)]
MLRHTLPKATREALAKTLADLDQAEPPAPVPDPTPAEPGSPKPPGYYASCSREELHVGLREHGIHHHGHALP